MDNLTNPDIPQYLFDAIAETSDCFGVFDSNDKLIFCNPTLAEIFGRSQAAIMHQSFSQLT